jgi:hypothetical protein
MSSLTANRLVNTNGTKVLTSNAALTAAGVLLADASGFPSTDTDMTFVTNKLTVTNLDVSTDASILSATGSTLARFDSNKKLESNAALTANGMVIADASGWPTTDTDATWDGTNKLTLTNLDVSTNLKIKSATVSKVAKIDSSGYVTSGTASDASMEAVIAPILIDASGTGGTTLTATMMQSYRCQFTNIGQGASDASVTLPTAGPNMHCQGTVVTAQANKWGVYDSTGTMTVIDASGATLTTASTYGQFDNAVAGQSFDVWTQKYDATTYRWFVKPRAVGAGRTFTQ